jgi:exopolysaccharide biosynthesis polyprenyl glycosylphosphotransferase
MTRSLNRSGFLFGADLAISSIVLAVMIRIQVPDAAGDPLRLLVMLVVPFGLIWAGILAIDGYSLRRDMRDRHYAAEHILVIGAAAVATLIALGLVRLDGDVLVGSRIVVAVGFPLIALLTLLLRRLFYHLTLSRSPELRYLAVGSPAAMEPVVSALREESRFGRPNFQFVESPQDLAAALGQTGPRPAGIVYSACLLEDGPSVLPTLLAGLGRGLPICSIERLCELELERIPTIAFDTRWIIDALSLEQGTAQMRAKRLVDIVLSAFGLLLAGPILGLLALAIRLDSKGPAVLHQERVGLGGKLFRLHKFRSMRTDMPNAGGGLYTLKDDPRITRIGRFLRVSRLDEVPQLGNVLVGEMSLIGPRPELVALADNYAAQIPRYHLRHAVKPGITGLAQIRFPYGASVDDARRKMEYDLYYVKNAGVMLDLEIVLRTAQVMLSRSGR